LKNNFKNPVVLLNKHLRYIFSPILFIWEFPQNLLGILVYLIMKNRNRVTGIEIDLHRLFIQTPNTGVSLGLFVFWTPSGNRFPHLKNDCRMHEFGHARQSALLGPLYLLIVGIPSVARVFYSRWYSKKHGHRWGNYYSAFPENWADKLGGVFTGLKK
jgi:hypothetical protein